MEMEASYRKHVQIFVRLLNGRVRTFQFPSPRVYGDTLKRKIFEITGVPTQAQRLVYGNHQVEDSTVITQSDGTVHLLLRLLGGKGGFGSLLRGAATKAGHKKTSNFDACRDMNGRRLRHVNAEKKLEEWKAEAEERKLEKIAEEFINKKAKKGKRGGGRGDADEKCVEKYREESAKCKAVVEESVRAALRYQNGKRKEKVLAGETEAKRLKIWMGKRKMTESDNDDMDSSEDDEKENEKSVVINSGSHSDSSTEAHDSCDLVAGMKQDQASSEEGKATAVLQSLVYDERVDVKEVTNEENGAVTVAKPEVDVPEVVVQPKELKSSGCDADKLKEPDSQPLKVLTAENEEGMQKRPIDADVNGVNDSEAIVCNETASAVLEQPEKPLNFDDFCSAAEMEAYRMDRLKLELQNRGLKCGGTLQERAARLFLLKSTPFDKIPKKLLAKK